MATPHFFACGYLEGPTSHWQPAICACSEALPTEQSKYGKLVTRLIITTILHLRDLNTGQAKKLHYAGGTKSMGIKTIVFIFDSVKDCTETVCNRIGTNLYNKFNNLFNIKITFGGNAVNCGSSVKGSLEEFFLTEDAINLAMASYFNSIGNQTFSKIPSYSACTLGLQIMFMIFLALSCVN